MPAPGTTSSLGRSGFSVTRLGLGTAPIGGLFQPVTEEAATETVRTAFTLGLRYFDTAPLYGFGNAESRLGRGLAGIPREQVAVSTKVGRLLRADAPRDEAQFHDGEPVFRGAPAVNPVFDFSYDGVMRSVEESLARLQMARVDILYIHDPDDHYEIASRGAVRALDRLRSEGVVHAIGVGMTQTAMLERFAREFEVDCLLLAGRYTLLDQSALHSLLPTCLERGVSIVIGGVYNSGILADPKPGSTFNYVPAGADLLARAGWMQAVCKRHSVPLKAAAIQFPLGHAAVASVLTGARSASEIEENAAMFAWPIPDELWTELRAEGLLPESTPTPSSA